MTTEELSKLTLNFLSEDDYANAKEAGALDENQLYLTPEEAQPNEDSRIIFEAVSTVASKTIELAGLDFEKNVDYELYVEGMTDTECGIYLRFNDNINHHLVYMEGDFQYQEPAGHLGAYTQSTMHAQYENGFHLGPRMCPEVPSIIRYRFRILDSGRIMATWECVSATDAIEPYYAKGWGFVSEEHWGYIRTIYLICPGTITFNIGCKFIIRRLG